MDYAIPYVIWRFFYRIKEFLRDWYVVSSYAYVRAILGYMRHMDRTLAFKITLRNIFKPLYGDYSFAGHLIAFPFRIVRLFVSGLVYLIFLCGAVTLYLCWILLPVVLLVRIFI